MDGYADLSGVAAEDLAISKFLRFLPVARAFAEMSKDSSTKVGTLILGPDYEVRSSGWNGAVRGSRADEDKRAERPEKYHWFSHAEMNAIAQAAKMGTPLEGCTMVVTHPPCMICARLTVQAGIKRVVCPAPSEDFARRWSEDLARTKELFEECSIRYVEVP